MVAFQQLGGLADVLAAAWLVDTNATLICCLQLTLDNALAPYLTNQFGFSITKAGNLAAIFGIMNFGARPAGGVLSDVLGKRFGIRGRIWALFFVFSLGGFFVAMTGVLANHPFKVTLAMYILAGIFLEVRGPHLPFFRVSAVVRNSLSQAAR